MRNRAGVSRGPGPLYALINGQIAYEKSDLIRYPLRSVANPSYWILRSIP